MKDLQPKKRSKIRLVAGKLYFMSRRYIYWYLSGTRFARKRPNKSYERVVFSHRTPLIRKLKDVDMWMQYNKIENLKIATSRIDGTVIMPGETFSFWKTVGRPTRRKGYKEGMVLFNGRVIAGVGGGLCQLSNLIYWMTLHTPLTVVERWRHSYDVFPDSNRTQPFGSGATCSYNYIDLQIRNDTSQPFVLRVRVTDTHLEGEWRSDRDIDERYEIYEKEHYITQQLWGGYTRHNVIARMVYNSQGIFLRDEEITENNAIMMYQPFITEGNFAYDRIKQF